MTEPTYILYTSLAGPELDHDLLSRLIQEASPWHQASGVGGAVLMHDGRLLQVLEGPAHAVQGCFRRLSADARHAQVTLLAMGPLEDRRFATGTMRHAQVHPGLAQPVSEVLTQLVQRPDAVNVEAAMRLLRTLAPSTLPPHQGPAG